MTQTSTLVQVPIDDDDTPVVDTRRRIDVVVDATPDGVVHAYLPGRAAIAPGAANYRGNRCTDVLGTVMGPNMFGERLTAADAVYDPNDDITRVTFAYTTTDDLQGATR